MLDGVAHSKGQLRARPVERTSFGPAAPGVQPVQRIGNRAGLLYVPASVEPSRPNPLVVMLHGAGATASDVIPMVTACADEHSVVVLAPTSRGATWDMIQRTYGPDVAALDQALRDLFRSYFVDPEHIAIAGFSDGASYALSLGLANGDLFSDILAFSPGFAAPTRAEESPRIFISHGREDRVLPIDRCGRRVARVLTRSGYDVDYREFSGGHVVLSDLVQAAFVRFLSPK
jgi:phospholipase/carboxylesterase